MKQTVQKLKIIIWGALFFAISSFAQEVKISVEPALISLLDRAVLQIEFNNVSPKSIEMPKVDGLEIVHQGPEKNYQIVNGSSSFKIIHRYLITPSDVGEFKLGPVLAKYKGGEKTLSTTLKVIKPKDDPDAQELSDLLYSTIESDRKAPHANEPFTLTLKVHVRDGVNVGGNFNITGGLPESGIDGVISWEVVNRSREEIDGAIYTVFTVKGAVKTLTSGTFTFQPHVQMNLVVPRQKRRSYGASDPFFGDLFARQESRAYILECNKLDLKVLPIPISGRPDSYSGAVGHFDFDVSIGPESVKAGEPITIKMRIKGTGNLSQIMPPALPNSSDYKLYDPSVIPSDNEDEVLFEQVFIPKSSVVTNIPSIAFSYFNTTTADFRILRKGPFPITVESMPAQVAQVISASPGLVSVETKVLGRDIVYLKSAPVAWKLKSDLVWYQQRRNQLLLALPLLLLALVAVVSTWRNHLDQNVAFARRQKALKVAMVHVQRAHKAANRKNQAGFYQALWDALTEYFGHRLNLAPGEVTFQKVAAQFPSKNDELENLFRIIEHNRYGLQSESQSSKHEMKALLKSLSVTLKKCERMRR